MKTRSKVATMIGMAFALAIAGGSVLAHRDGHTEMQGMGKAMMGAGMGRHAAHAGGTHMGCHHMGQGGMHGVMARGAAGTEAKPSEQAPGGGARSLFTPQERQAMHEQMHAAATPEERHALAAAHRAEMQRRAAERGITLPEQHGSRMGRGMGSSVPASSPETSSD